MLFQRAELEEVKQHGPGNPLTPVRYLSLVVPAHCRPEQMCTRCHTASLVRLLQQL